MNCRDSFHFLEKLPDSGVSEDSLLVTLDVVSLYTSIPHDLGVQAIEFWLHEKETSLRTRFVKGFILSAINLILKNNYFQFQDEVYLQLSGTAMGTKMAPTYAILVMGFLEEKCM